MKALKSPVAYFIIVLIILPAIFLARAEPSRWTRDGIIPRAIEELYLGMPLKELQSKRPMVEQVEILNSVQYYSETDLGSVFFDKAFYFFDNGELIKIVLRKNAETLDFIEMYRLSFLKGAVTKWGDNFELFIRIHRGYEQANHYLPVVVWRKSKSTIAVIYTPSCDLSGQLFNSLDDPIARFALFYFEVVIMKNSLSVKNELSALDLVPVSEVIGADCLFDGLGSDQ
jgi:hypothetical protein